MPRRKYNITPENVNEYLPEGYLLRVRHKHAGNSSPEARMIKGNRVSPYVTEAFVIRQLPSRAGRKPKYEVAARASAVCHPNDSPHRKLSYRIAAGRVIRRFDDALRS